MAHAFLITAYKDPTALIELIDELGPSAYVYIHWDRRGALERSAEKAILTRPQVKFLSRRYAVNWGSTRHLLAILELADAAVKEPLIDRLHAISASDRPLLPVENFDRFFRGRERKEFIVHFPLPSPNWQGGGLQRLTLYHPLDFLDVKKRTHAKIRNILIKMQGKLKIRRSLKGLPPLFGGSTWWSLTRECVFFMLDRIHSEPMILKRSRMTHVPEEILFQTLIMDSLFAAHVVNDDLRYIDWEMRNGNVPAVLDSTDLDRITKSGKLFARKLEYPVSAQLIKELAGYRASLIERTIR